MPPQPSDPPVAHHRTGARRHRYGWEHELVVEARTVAEDGQAYPACIAGEGACPPEDCGGVYGFAELKEVLAGPDSEKRDEMQEWVGEDFDPAHFDLAAANTAVAVV